MNTIKNALYRKKIKPNKIYTLLFNYYGLLSYCRCVWNLNELAFIKLSNRLHHVYYKRFNTQVRVIYFGSGELIDHINII